MKLLCSHGGRLVPPRGPGGAARYAGGETRVLAVPRGASFRELAGRLSEMAGGAEVRAVLHRLADADEGLEDVLVSVTCDEELAHMRDEYDRLRAARPAARFRVFVTTAAPAPAGSGGGSGVHRGRPAGLPPLAPKMRRVQSEQAQLHRRPAHPAPVRRVRSAEEIAARLHVHPSFHHRRQQQQCCCGCSCHCQRRELCAPAPAAARPAYAAPYMSRKEAAAPWMPAAMATGRMVCADAAREMARSTQAAMESNRRAIWEFE
ncbi:hypothetical protein PVAP13_9KG042500 [Panicum virgatum]|uniref:PB1 domain-containing protein n=1 Tax=Panicum virgatum TaxID=38727 RepID=A0A8T0NBV7_PANVG|nr:hypothetical protein PVAP13_9KG042500 [Panicum virgatum]